MAQDTAIEWCDHTFNGWIGCTQVSPGCDHCYAAFSTPARTQVVEWGAGKPRRRTSAANWKQPIYWDRKPFVECAECHWRGEARKILDISGEAIGWEKQWCPNCRRPKLQEARRRVFCASLADWLDNEVPAEWLADLLDLIRLTPDLDWLLLTKRIGNWQARLTAAHQHVVRTIGGGTGEYAAHPLWALGMWIQEWIAGAAPANVWIGATICNQAEADRDVPKLRRVPAAVRFLSVEPMLGHVDLFTASTIGREANAADPRTAGSPWIDWVIVGGESGRHARPMHPDWARSLRDQCAAAGVAFLFKQWGEWAPDWYGAMTCADCGETKNDASVRRKGIDECSNCGSILWNDASKPDDDPRRVGKKAAGRLLDGVLHDGFPPTAGAAR